MKKILLTLLLAVGFLVSPASPVTPASAFGGHPWSTCGSATWLGARICFDKSDEKVYIYSGATGTPAYQFTAKGMTVCSPFVASPSEHIVYAATGTLIQDNDGVNDIPSYCGGNGSAFTMENTPNACQYNGNTICASQPGHDLIEWFGNQDFDFLVVN